MSRLLIPNTTQVPNIFLDEVIPKLPPGAVRVLLAIVRFTYGFGKASDCISLTQLQGATGLSREGVSKGIKALGDLLQVKPGARGKGANEYSLNLDTSTGQLVRKSDQSENLTSQLRPEKVVRKVDSPKPIRSKPRERADKAHPLTAKDSDPRVKEFLTWWADEYHKRVGSPYSIQWGKEGKLAKNLIQTFDLAKVKDLALRFLDSKDSWVQEHGGYTLGVFASQINRLVSTGKANQPQRKEMPL